MRIALVFLCLYLLSRPAFAQKQDNNWCFGEHFGLSFNTNPPSAFTGSQLNTEANATVSDPNTGALLFYTDGKSIWDRNHNPMPNGNNIGITNSNSQQGAVIAPDPANSDRYYVFSVEGGGTTPDALYFSVVDMNLNSGLGDVITSKKKVKIDNGFGEMMTVVPGNNCDLWLVVLRHDPDAFWSYNISAAGINTTPVISVAPIGLSGGRYLGGIKVSPDRSRMAATFRTQTFSVGMLALYDFNPNTGKVSNAIMISGTGKSPAQGCEFSPNSKRLYVPYSSGIDGKGYDLSQLDISLPTATDIYNSKQIVANVRATAIQAGPDGDIYVMELGSSLSKISNADALVPGCVYTQSIIQFPQGISDILSLPQKVPFTNFHLDLGRDTTICKNEKQVLNPGIPGASYLWQDGSTGNSMTVNSTGKYYVTITKYGCTKTDTINVSVINPPEFSLGADTNLCPGIEYKPTVPSGYSKYEWSTGGNTPGITINKAGIYWLKVYDAICTNTDTVRVDYYDTHLDLGRDTTVCSDDTLYLKAGSIRGCSYHWQDGSTSDKYMVTAPGKYHVTVTNECGIFTDTISVRHEQCYCTPSIPGAFTPNNDGLNDKFGPVVNCKVYEYKFMVVNRFGETVFKSTVPGEKWNGTYKGVNCELGTYYYMVQITGPQRKDYFYKGDILLLR